VLRKSNRAEGAKRSRRYGAGDDAVPAGGLPDVVYKRTELRLFGTYGWTERSTIRFDAGYQRLTYEDWGFAYGGTPFLYSDNTTIYIKPSQNVGYLGLSYIYSWK
jgi:hypothetical protein